MRRRLRALAALLLIIFLLNACALGVDGPDATVVPDGAAPAQPSPQPIVIGFGAQEYERAAYAPLIDAFNNDTPDIRVLFVPLDDAIRDELGKPFAPGELARRIVGAADTAASSYIGPDALGHGYFYDLRPLIDADPNFGQDDYYPGALAAFTDNGNMHMLPHTLPVALLSYNRDLWSARGVPLPKPDWSWSDLIAAAEQVAQRRRGDRDVYGLLDSGRLALLGELERAGVNLFAAPHGQLRLDTPAMASALERVAALEAAGAIYMPPFSPDQPAPTIDPQKLIQDQRIGIWMADMGMFSDGPPKPSFAIGTAAFPALSIPFLVGGAQGYVMSSGTQHPEAAWRWLAFLSRQEAHPPGQFVLPHRASQIPARKSLADRSGYWNSLDAEAAAAVKAVLGRPVPPMAADSLNQYALEPLFQALQAVVGGTPANKALRAAQATFDQGVAQIQLTPTAAPNTAPIVVATPVSDAIPAGATPINFVSMGNEPSLMQGIVKAYNAGNTGVYVQLKGTEVFTQEWSLNSLAAASDCFVWFGPPQANEISATLDLQPLLDADAAFPRDDYPPALLDTFKQGGRLSGLPYLVTFRTLTYNKTAFDAAGLPYPMVDWTTDDLLNAAKKLTSGTGDAKQYGFASPGDQGADMFFFLRRFGAALTTGGNDAPRPNFTDRKVAQAARYYLTLMRDFSPHKQILAFNRTSDGSDTAFQLLTAGKLGMWLNLGNFSFFSNEQPRFTLAVAPLPLGSGRLGAEDFHVSGMFISAHSRQPEACWTWLKHLSGQVANIQRANSGQNEFPARRSVAASDAFAQQAMAGSVDVYKVYATALARTPASAEMAPGSASIEYYWFFRALDRALQGNDLDRELAEAQRVTEQHLDCVRGGGDQAVCATEVDPNYQGYMSAPPTQP